jgi:hypothetical protein
MMGKSVFFSEGTAGQMKSAPSFAKDDDSTLPKEPNGSKIGLGPKPIWGMSDKGSNWSYAIVNVRTRIPCPAVAVFRDTPADL